MGAHPGAFGERFLRESSGESIAPQEYPEGRRARCSPLVLHCIDSLRGAFGGALINPSASCASQACRCALPCSPFCAMIAVRKQKVRVKIVSFFYDLWTALKGATNGGSTASVSTSRQELVDAARMRTELGISSGVTAVAVSPSESRSAASVWR